MYDLLSGIIARHPTHKGILLMGDLNSRVQEGHRTSSPICLENPFGLLDTTAEGLEDMELYPARPRQSLDKKRPNSRGQQCLAFCEDHSMDILNGAHPGDQPARYTCENKGRTRGYSTIDLCIVSAGLFDKVSQFTVSDFHDFSDHAFVTVRLHVGKIAEGEVEPTAKRAGRATMRWDQTRWQLYAKKVEKAMQGIELLTEQVDHLASDGLDRVTQDMCSILSKCTFKAFGGAQSKKAVMSTGGVSFSWWDEDCEAARAKMRAEHRRCKREGILSDETLRLATGAFKRLIKQKRREAMLRADLELASRIKSNPASFWKLVSKRKAVSKIDDCEAAVAYFTSMLDGTEPNQAPAQCQAPPSSAPVGMAPAPLLFYYYYCYRKNLSHPLQVGRTHGEI